MLIRIVTSFLLICHVVTSYKVLVYSSKFGFSHMNYLGSIADTLQAAGNNVTVLQPVINKEVRGTGCQLAKVLTIEEDEATVNAITPMLDKSMWAEIWTVSARNPIGALVHAPHLYRCFDAGMRNVLGRKDVMEQLRNEKFDIAITETFDYAGFPIFHELGISKIIGVSSSVLMDRITYALGSPIQPSYVPPVQAGAGDDGSFSSRLSNVIFTAFSWGFEGYLEGPAQEYMTKHHPNAPSIRETIGNMPVYFTNAEPFLDFPRAKLHKVVDLGGIGLKPAKNLDENWMKVLSQRKRNVLISFGSIAPSSLMPLALKENIVKVVKKFPDVTFVWKYETPEDGFGADVPNLHRSKWTPQTDLLASGYIDLFLTHGGAGSVLESASSGVPLIVVPLFGDQHRNALGAERFGFATEFSKHKLGSEEDLTAVIKKGLEDKDLRDKAQLAKDLLKSKPFSPQELLIRHVDLAVKFGEIPSLAPSGRHFSIIQYHNLDVLALLVLLGFTLIVTGLLALRWCLCSSRSLKIKKQ